MDRKRRTLISLWLLALSLLAIPTASLAAARFVGTWKGTVTFAGSGAGSPDYGTATAQLVVTDQVGRLCRGSITLDDGGGAPETLGVTGTITDRKVELTTYDNAETTLDFYDLTYYPIPRVLRGTFRTMDAVSGIVTLKRQ